MDRGGRYSYYRLMHIGRLPCNLTLHWRKLEHHYSASWSIRIEINLHGQLNRRLGGWRTSGNLYESDHMLAFAVWDYLALHVSGGVGTWGVFPSPSSPTPTPPLNSVFMLSPTNGWAVGDNATILEYTVSGGVGTWNPIAISGTPTLSTDANLTSIFMLNPTTGWIVGGIQNGCNPSEPECAAVGNPTGLPSPPAEIENPQAAAAGPISLYWDGTKWEPVPMPPLPGKIASTGIESGTLKSVFFTSPNDGWTVGLPGKLTASIYHWDGTSWRVVVLSPPLIGQIPGQVPPVLSSVYMTSGGNGWIVGGDPGITGSSYTTWPPVSLNPPPNSPQG